jgi:hypothetical protein
VLGRAPGRLAIEAARRTVAIRANVRRWGTPEERAVFRRAFPLVALGAPDASVGT